MDHAEPPPAIDGRWPYILAVRDLASGCQLAWLPVLDETAETTIDALQWLFLEHGPPLVLKSDNGSGFISAAMRRFLDRWQVRPLFSPPCTPEYNGGIEAGNGALKTRTHEEAARQGRAGHWTADDMEAARRMANELIYPHGPAGPTRHERFRSAPRISLDGACGLRPHGRARANRRAPQARLSLGHGPGPCGPGANRPCSNRLCSRRARLPYFHPEVNYSTNYIANSVENFVGGTRPGRRCSPKRPPRYGSFVKHPKLIDSSPGTI